MTSRLLPPPCDVGLPSKFTAWRPRQDDAIIRAAESSARFVVLCMPTGSGKSLTYMAIAKLVGWRTAILTATKGLQNQAIADFAPCGLVDVRGMGNYPCEHLIRQDRLPMLGRQPGQPPMCDIGPCTGGMKCEFYNNGCEYYSAVATARTSDYVITNYAYWLTMQQREPDKGLGRFDMLVLDEAHDAPEELGSFLGVEVTINQLQHLLGMDWPSDHQDWDEWKRWAKVARRTAIEEWEARAGEVKGNTATRKVLQEYRELRRLDTNLGRVASSTGEWVHTMGRSGPHGTMRLQFDPIWPGEYAEKALFVGIPKIILTSATVRPKTMELLGVKPADIDFIEFPSTFPVSRRPVIWSPTIRMDRRATDGDKRMWVIKIDNIIRRRLDRKGIIHTVSYERRDWILKFSEFRSIMMTHETATARERIAAFKRAPAPAVMVSPSLTTGYDFPYEECAYQIIGKVPFPDSRNKIIAARTKKDEGYPYYLAMQTLVQSAGRGMRAEDDACETIVIDDHIGWFMWKWADKFAPKWFKDSFRKMAAGIPEPLEIKRRG